jgi:hypothetical protein
MDESSADYTSDPEPCLECVQLRHQLARVAVAYAEAEARKVRIVLDRSTTEKINRSVNANTPTELAFQLRLARDDAHWKYVDHPSSHSGLNRSPDEADHVSAAPIEVTGQKA